MTKILFYKKVISLKKIKVKCDKKLHIQHTIYTIDAKPIDSNFAQYYNNYKWVYIKIAKDSYIKL